MPPHYGITPVTMEDDTPWLQPVKGKTRTVLTDIYQV